MLTQRVAQAATALGDLPNKSAARCGWGGPRANSGGPRPNSGGRRPGAGRPRKCRAVAIEASIAAGERWYVVETEPRGELIAEAALAALGYDSWCPRERIEVVWRSERLTVERPLFVGYSLVCINLSASWSAVVSADAVRRLVRQAGSWRPAPLPDGTVEALRAHADAAGVVMSGPGIEMPHAPIAPGSRVKIDGALGALDAVCEMSGEERLVVLMDILGATRRVTLARNCVRA